MPNKQTQNESQPSEPPSSRRPVKTTDEAAIFSTFARIVQSKFSDANNIEQLDKLYKSPDFAREKAKLTEMNNNGMAWGLGVGLGTFLFLRKAPAAITRYMLKRRNLPMGGAGGGYRFDANGGQSPFGGGAANADQPRKPGIIFRVAKFGLDIFVSTSLAMYASAFFADKRKLMKDASEVPLVEGRSLISDELCADFIKAYKDIPQGTWSNYRGKNEVLGAIENFVLNCRRREVYEMQLKAEEGIRPGGTVEHVPIPSPGVPRDMNVTLDDIVSEQGDDGNGDKNFTDSYFGTASEDGNYDGVIGEWESIDDFENNAPGRREG